MNSARVNPRHSRPLAAKGNVRPYQSGLTLLELLISLTLGLLLLTGVGTIFIGSNQTYRVQEQNARIQESGRYALDVLGRSLRQAGYWDMPLYPTAPYASGFGDTPICGTANSPSTPCTATTFTVRYDGTGASDCSGAVVAAGTLVTEAIDLNTNNLRCNTSPLVSNVEDLQFLYGIDNDPSGAPGYQSADRYVAVPTAAQEPLVVSVRACVLIRSEQPGIANSQSYLNCAGALGTATGAAAFTTAGDSRLRRTFVATFNLRNRVTIQP